MKILSPYSGFREEAPSETRGTWLKGKILPAAVLALFWGGGYAPVVGQEGAFAVEIRGGAALPVSSFRTGDEGWAGEAGLGSSFGIGFTFPAPGPFGSFLGFGQRRFSCDGPLCKAGSDWLSTGFDVALRLVMGKRRIRPWLRGGLHTHLVEGRILEEGDIATYLRSDTGAGFEVGGGLLVAIGERTSLSPCVQYGWGKVSFPGRSALRLRYLSAEVGVMMGF